MKSVKFGLGGLPVPLLIQFCREVVTKMTGNANFTTPSPTLATITANINALEAAYTNALDGGKSLKALVRVKKQTLLDSMRLLGNYVQNAAGGDETKILSSGFAVKKAAVKNNELPDAPVGLLVKSSVAGSLDIKWAPVAGALVYELQATTVADATTGWVHIGNSSSTKFTYSGLVAGTKYWIRVAAINKNGQSAYSDVAHGMVIG